MNMLPVLQLGPLTTPPVHRISVEEYEKMIDAGVFLSGPKLELIEGVLVQKMTQNPPHSFCLGEVEDALKALVPSTWHLRVQCPLALDDSRPEPDLVVIPFSRRELGVRHPRGEEVALVVEIAETSLEYDRTVKSRLYAGAGVRVYLLLNIPERVVELYTEPDGSGETAHYRALRTYGEDEPFALCLAGLTLPEIRPSQLLP
jgi:hypothetical protein